MGCRELSTFLSLKPRLDHIELSSVATWSICTHFVCFFFSWFLVSLSNFVLAMGNVIKPRAHNISTSKLMNALFVFLLIVWALCDQLRCRKWTMICRKFHRTSFGKHREMSGQSICSVPFIRFSTHGYQLQYTSFIVGHKRKKAETETKQNVSAHVRRTSASKENFI